MTGRSSLRSSRRPRVREPRPNILDVWSVGQSGTYRQLASLTVDGAMEHSAFAPHSHLLLFNPAPTNEVLPDILDPDPDVTYHAMCATTQNVLSRSAWAANVPAGIPYEPPC
jgi:hypothetical protein